MRVKNYGLIEALATMSQKTPKDFLTDLLSRHSKQESMAAELGISRSAIVAAINRHGIAMRKSCEFEYRGVVDCFRGHCRRHGINFKNAQQDCYRLSLTKIQSLDYWLSRKPS